MTVIEITEKVQEGVLKAVESSQASTLSALRATSSSFDMIKPDASLFPFAELIPSATESLEVGFDFLAKLLDAQRSFLAGIVEIYDAPAAPETSAKKS
jgi:hypothetical protein